MANNPGNQRANPQARNNPGNQNGNPLNDKLDFNRISDLPSKYPRIDLPESLEGNM
jgi:hypothetical protein